MAATAATAAALDAQGFRSLLSEQAELFKKLQGLEQEESLERATALLGEYDRSPSSLDLPGVGAGGGGGPSGSGWHHTHLHSVSARRSPLMMLASSLSSSPPFDRSEGLVDLYPLANPTPLLASLPAATADDFYLEPEPLNPETLRVVLGSIQSASDSATRINVLIDMDPKGYVWLPWQVARVLEVMETRAERRAAAKLIGGCVAESGKELEQVIRSALPWEGKTEQSHLCSSLRGTIA